jgi:hypothetical protein
VAHRSRPEGVNSMRYEIKKLDGTQPADVKWIVF